MTMRKYFMQLTNEMYEELGEGLVRVTDGDGKSGIFKWNGSWVEGNLRQANNHMLAFCGGPNIPKEFNFHWVRSPWSDNTESGWPEPYERHLKSWGII